MTSASAGAAGVQQLYTCSTSDVPFATEAELKAHYRSDWHRYNLKRKVAGLPPVTRDWFEARRTKLLAGTASAGPVGGGAGAGSGAGGPGVEEKPAEMVSVRRGTKANAVMQVWICPLTRKRFANEKTWTAHTATKKFQDLVKKSGAPAPNALRQARKPAAGAEDSPEELKKRQRAEAAERKRQLAINRGEIVDEEEEEDDGSGWETASDEEEEEEEENEAGPSDGAGPSAGAEGPSPTDAAIAAADWDACRCLFCNEVADSVPANFAHMYKRYGFVVPDVANLSDAVGLMRYLGAKLTVARMPLYESGLKPAARAPFRSLHAVQRHMVDTNQCRLLYDGNEEEYEDYYVYADEAEGDDVMDDAENPERALVGAGGAGAAPRLELVSGGLELAVRSASGGEKVLGSREMARYYKQNHRRTETRESVLVNALLARYQALGVATAAHRRALAPLRKTQKSEWRAHRTRNTGLFSSIDKFSAWLPKDCPY